MRILITTLLLCISAVIFAQVPTSFQGTLNIYQSSGASPNYEIRGIFNDTQGRYTADSADVGDKIFILDGANCVELEIISIISTTGGILRCNVTDIDAVLINPPLATGAIMEPTPNYGFPTFVDGISNDLLACIRTHFTLLVDDISSGGITGVPGNTQDTVVQIGHGLSLLDPVFVNASGNWILSNISDEDSCHMAIVTEVISSDTIIITYNGLTDQPGHGYTVGSVYFVQDDGTYATTVPTNFINDIAFYVVSDSTLYITEQRIVSPMTDLNGIYSTSDTIPDGTIATGDEFSIKGKTNPNYEFKFWPSNDNIYIKSDSVLLTFSSSEAVFRDYKTVPTGIEYNDSGYVTNPLSLTTKEYVDSLAASASVADGDKGDIVVSGSGTVWDIDTGVVGANELASTAVTPGSYGNSTNIPTITIDVDGRITAAANTAISTHDPVTVTDGTTIDLTLSTQNITAEVKPESIQASHIDTNAVTTSEIQDGTITTTDLAFTVNGGSGATNQVTYWGGTNTLAGDTDFQFNGDRVGIGGTIDGTARLTISGTGASGATLMRLRNSTPTNVFDFLDNARLDIGAGNHSSTLYLNSGGAVTSTIFFGANSGTGVRIFRDGGSNGNLNIGSATGTARLVLNIGNGSGLIWNATSNTQTTTSCLLLSSGSTYSGSAFHNNSNFLISNAVTNPNIAAFHDNGSFSFSPSSNISGAVSGMLLERSISYVDTLQRKISYTGINIRGTYNIPVFATAITRGIFINPTLTSAPNWRAIDIATSSGHGIYQSQSGVLNYFEGDIGIGVSSSQTADFDLNGSARFRSISTPGSVEDGETWTSSTQKALVSNQAGVTQAINGTLFTGTSTVTVNNTAAETTLIPTGTGTVTLPANFWTIGKTLEITAYGDWRTDTVPSTLELRMELGGTLLCTTSAQTMVATEGAQWKATATVTCRSTGVSGTTMSEGELRMNSDADTSVIYQMYRSTTNTINTTASAAFDITVTHGAADPFNEMRLYTLTIKVLN